MNETTAPRERKGRDYLTLSRWDEAYERYANGSRLDDVYAAMEAPKHRTLRAFQNSFYARRRGLQERYEARQREFALAEPFEKFHVRHRAGYEFEILAKRKSGSLVFGPFPMQEAHWIAGRLNG